jgi:hypothetical protein
MDLRAIVWRSYGLDRSGSGKEPVEGSYEHDNHLSGSIKCWKYLE